MFSDLWSLRLCIQIHEGLAGGSETRLPDAYGCRVHSGLQDDTERRKAKQPHENWHKKAELLKFTLFQLISWYIDQVELQKEQSLITIIQLIGRDRLCQAEVKQVQYLQFRFTNQQIRFPV